MLTSLLPGLRELRAPLSAGVLWLLAIWFLVEPSVPDGDAATGVLASAYRLTEPLSAVGAGAALGFGAYLLGSLSVFVFSGQLRRLIPVTTRVGRLGLAGLSPAGEEALRQVARDARQRLETTLGLSGYGVSDVLERTVRQPAPPSGSRAAGRRPRQTPATTLNRGTRVLTPEQEVERRLADLVVRDLEVIPDAQLLGRENDVFSAVDRNRAEFEFRLAVIPGLLALAGSLGARQLSWWTGPAVVLLGLVAAGGLMLDAARQRRAANDLLLNLLEETARLRAPSLTRLETRAQQLADQSPAAVPRLAGETVTAVRRVMDLLDNLARSGTATIHTALEAALAARSDFDRLQSLLRRFDPAGAPLDRSVLTELEGVAAGWAAHLPPGPRTVTEAQLLPDGRPSEVPSPEDLAARMQRARTGFRALEEELRGRAQTIGPQQSAAPPGAGAPAARDG